MSCDDNLNEASLNFILLLVCIQLDVHHNILVNCDLAMPSIDSDLLWTFLKVAMSVSYDSLYKPDCRGQC